MRTLTIQDSARALVYFTIDRVNPEGLATIKSLKTQEDVVIRMNSIFVDYKEGVSASKIDTKAIDRSFGIRSTGRNMNTLLKLRALS